MMVTEFGVTPASWCRLTGLTGLGEKSHKVCAKQSNNTCFHLTIVKDASLSSTSSLRVSLYAAFTFCVPQAFQFVASKCTQYIGCYTVYISTSRKLNTMDGDCNNALLKIMFCSILTQSQYNFF